jgi:hypothetical protein
MEKFKRRKLFLYTLAKMVSVGGSHSILGIVRIKHRGENDVYEF